MRPYLYKCVCFLRNQQHITRIQETANGGRIIAGVTRKESRAGLATGQWSVLLWENCGTEARPAPVKTLLDQSNAGSVERQRKSARNCAKNSQNGWDEVIQ